jgi:hypothetical protein
MIPVTSFEDSSPDTTMDWLATGLSARLRNQLAQVVVPVGVSGSVVLGGTVQVSGNEVVALVELLDRAGGSTLWTQEFKGTADDPMELEERVLLQVVRVFERRLVKGPARPRGHVAQIAWFRWLANGDYGGDPVTQRYWLERVLAEDPQFAPAYEAAFWIYMQHARAYTEPAWVTKAAEALDQAEELGLQQDWGFAKARTYGSLKARSTRQRRIFVVTCSRMVLVTSTLNGCWRAA